MCPQPDTSMLTFYEYFPFYTNKNGNEMFTVKTVTVKVKSNFSPLQQYNVIIYFSPVLIRDD